MKTKWDLGGRAALLLDLVSLAAIQELYARFRIDRLNPPQPTPEILQFKPRLPALKRGWKSRTGWRWFHFSLPSWRRGDGL